MDTPNTAAVESQAVAQMPTALIINTQNVPFNYNFKTIWTDAAGNKVKKTTENEASLKEYKRPTFSTNVPVPTLASLFPGADIPMEDVKDKDGNVVGQRYLQPEHQTLHDMLLDVVSDLGKPIVDESASNEDIKFPADVFDFGKLSRAPKYTRKEGALSKEMLEEVCKSYTAEMQKLGKPEKGIKIACHYFMKRAKGLDAVRQEIVGKMRANLGTWFTSLPEDTQGEFAQAYQLLDGRIGEALGQNVDEIM